MADNATKWKKFCQWWKAHWDHVRAGAWLVVGISLVAMPFILCELCAPTSCATAATIDAQPCGVAVSALWALGGGVLGALLNVGRLRMSTQKREPRIERGLGVEPLVGAGVALIAYLAFITRQISIFPVTVGNDAPTFERVLLLGLFAGLLWEPLLVRIELIAQQDRKEESNSTSASGNGESASNGNN